MCHILHQLFDGKTTEQSLDHVRKNQNVKGFYFIPDFNNPTNEVMDIDTRKMIGRYAIQYQIPVSEDAIYSLYIPEPLPTITSFAGDFGILISSVSKILAPGLRLALMHVPAQYHQLIGNCLYAMQISSPSLMMQLFTRLVLSGQFEEIRRLRIEELEKRHVILSDNCKDIPIVTNSHSPIGWLLLPENTSPDYFEEKAMQHGLHLCSASRFMVGGSPAPEAVRLSLISEYSDERYVEGLRILNNLLTTE